MDDDRGKKRKALGKRPGRKQADRPLQPTPAPAQVELRGKKRKALGRRPGRTTPLPQPRPTGNPYTSIPTTAPADIPEATPVEELTQMTSTSLVAPAVPRRLVTQPGPSGGGSLSNLLSQVQLFDDLRRNPNVESINETVANIMRREQKTGRQ